MVVALVVLSVAFVIVCIHDYCLGRLLDRVSGRYISERNCLRSFVKVFLQDE